MQLLINLYYISDLKRTPTPACYISLIRYSLKWLFTRLMFAEGSLLIKEIFTVLLLASRDVIDLHPLLQCIIISAKTLKVLRRKKKNNLRKIKSLKQVLKILAEGVVGILRVDTPTILRVKRKRFQPGQSTIFLENRQQD
jgi:hypothetical protein